ncbi:MAG: serine hydrolase domain-containing protein [Bryobacteraceae bacterium]
MRILVGLLALAVSWVNIGSPLQAADPLSNFDFAARMDFYKVPGVSVAVIDGSKIVWAKGFGVLELGGTAPVTTETLFQAASISKPVAAMAMLKMVEQGKLSLDEPVNVKLKSWKIPENEFTKEKTVTLRMIVSHGAGFTVHGFPGYEAGEPLPTVPQILDGTPPANTAAVRVDKLPGKDFRYSGGGITIEQLLMTDVEHKPFADILQSLVLGPLGMKHSTYQQPLPPAKAAHAATAHLKDGTPAKGKWHIYPEMAAAGLWTTPSDLALFLIELQKKSGRVISAKMIDEMRTRQTGDYGLGLQMTGEHRFGHGGSNFGFKCQATATSDGKGVVVMTNGEQGGRLANEIVKALAEEQNWPK